MADNHSPDTMHLATMRYVDECVSSSVIVAFPFELTEANLQAVRRRKVVKGVVAAAGDSRPASADWWHGYYWSEPARWVLPKAKVRKIVFAGPWWLISMQMIGEARDAGVRSIVHRSWGRWWDTAIIVLIGMKLIRRVVWKLARGWQLAKPAGRMLSATMGTALRKLMRAAARVRLFGMVARRLAARHYWAKRWLSVLYGFAEARATPPLGIFREAISGVEKMPGFVPGRIVLVCGNLAPGGAQRQVVNTLLELRQCEFESLRLLCDYLTPDHLDKLDFFLPRLREAGIETREISAGKTSEVSELGGRPKALAYAAAALPAHLVDDISNLYWEFRDLKPEVVHAWLDWSNVRAGIAAAMAGVPRIVLSCRNLNPSHFDLYQNYMDPIYQTLVQLPNVVLLNNSHAGAADYARWLNQPVSKFRVVYNGVQFNGNKRASKDDIAALRDRLGISPRTAVVGSAFRFNPEKRPLLWIESAAAIAVKHPNVRFVAYGQGPMRNDMLERARELGIADAITLPGITDEINLALSSMDVLLLTSSGEGTPNVALEAQSVGTPVVANDAGGMKEAVEPNVTGWIVEEPDPQVIAEQVVALLENHDMAASARAAGPRFVETRFGVRRMMKETLLAYGVEAAPVGVRNELQAIPGQELHNQIVQYLEQLPSTDLYAKILKLCDFSMLHWEVLAILQYLVKRSRGAVLEIGSYLGAATIAIAQAAGKKPDPVITVEIGGSHDHPTIPSKDILGDLRRNLARYGVQDAVHMIEGSCDDPQVIGKIVRCLGGKRIDLLVIDAGGEVERDMLNFARFCEPSCYLVIDDYISEGAKEKSALIHPYLDRMVAEGKMRRIGVYGWGTWVGQLVDDRF